MARTHKVIGQLGDVNPLDYGGGIVFIHAQTGQPEIEWTEGVESEVAAGMIEQDDVDKRLPRVPLTAYRVPVPDDVVEYYDWADWDQIAHGYETGDTVLTGKAMQIMGQSSDPMTRAQLVVSLAQHHGWHELDQDPVRLEYGELERAWFPRGHLAKKV